MKIPTTLRHKPVIVCENYENIDGRMANNTDAKGLSVGLAQWNDRGKVDVSAKVWRHTGGKWSRQSEELPLHRVLDLAILVCKSLSYCRESYRYKNEEKTDIDRIWLQGDAMTVSLCKDNPMLEEDLQLFESVISKDDELLSERLFTLARILKEMDY